MMSNFVVRVKYSVARGILIAGGIVMCCCCSVNAETSKPKLKSFIDAILTKNEFPLPAKQYVVDLRSADADFVFEEVNVVLHAGHEKANKKLEIFSEWMDEKSGFFYFLNISGMFMADKTIRVDELVFYTPNDQILCTWVVDEDGDGKVDAITHKQGGIQNTKAHQAKDRYILQFHEGYGNLLLQQSYELARMIFRK